MGTVADTLAAARSQIGYNGGGNCGSPVTKFGAWAGVQTQWCAEFCSWCLDQAGVASADRFGRFGYGEDYCPAWVANFRSAGRFHASPEPGDLVFYSWNHDGVADHVGLVESVEADGSIVTIEGNTDDPTLANYQCGNCCRRKHRNTYYVLGYGRPAYTSEESTASNGASPITTPTPRVRPGMFELLQNAEGRVVAAGPGFWCDTTGKTRQITIDNIAQLQRSALCLNKVPRRVRDAQMVSYHNLYIGRNR